MLWGSGRERLWVKTHLPAGRPAVVEKENPGRPESNRLEKQMWWWNSISGRGKVFIGPGLEICPLTEECSSLGWLGVFLHHGKDPAMIQHCCLSWTSRPCCVAELTSVCFFPQNPPNCWFSHSQCSNHLSDDFSFFTAEWLTVSLATAEACHKWNTLRIFYLLRDEELTKEKSRLVHEISFESCHLFFGLILSLLCLCTLHERCNNSIQGRKD